MPIFRLKSVKIYTGQKKFIRAPPVTNMRYDSLMVVKFVIISLSYCHNLSPFSLMPPVPHAVQVGGCHICHRNCQNCQNRTVIFCCHFFPFSHLQHSPWHAPSPSCCPSCPAQSSPSVQGGSSPVTWG